MKPVIVASATLARHFCRRRTARIANPRPLPFTYPYETLPEGEMEVEQYVDTTPVRALSTATGQPGWINIFRLQTEFEYGLTDRLELGLYLQYVPKAERRLEFGPLVFERQRVKQRCGYACRGRRMAGGRVALWRGGRAGERNRARGE